MYFPDKPQQATRVVFIRHAESDRNIKDGKTRPLTTQGYVDAQRLPEALQGVPLDAVYSSPYRRAVETVQPLARIRGLEVLIKQGFHERISEWVEKPADWKAFIRQQWADFTFTQSDGESLDVVQNRNIIAVNEILTECPQRTVAVGTHGTALITVLNYYDTRYGYDDFARIEYMMPYVVVCDFMGSVCFAIHEIGGLQ